MHNTCDYLGVDEGDAAVEFLRQGGQTLLPGFHLCGRTLVEGDVHLIVWETLANEVHFHLNNY